MKQVFLAILLCTCFYSRAQFELPEFLMSDTLVTECDGRLLDSGGDMGLYGLNEDLTFTVCTETNISISFVGEFCVENGLDFLSVYDGPDVLSPILAENLTGTSLPSGLTSTSGCVTFHFTSDVSVSYCGFEIIWDSQNIEPELPSVSIPIIPECGSTILPITLSSEIYCSEIYLENSSLEANGEIEISSYTPVNCSEEGLTNSFELELAEPMDYNCVYDLNLEVGVHDNCDSIWLFNINNSLLYDQCEIPVEFTVGSNPLCNDQCTTIEATAQGCFTYEYIWDNGLPAGPGPHEVCPNGPTTYTVTVIEVGTATISEASFTFDHESILIDEDDLFLCQSNGNIDLNSTPEIGVWSGPGIVDEELGIFNPDNANPGVNTVYFEVDFTQCYDSLNITITEINAGDVTASCPFASPTLLTPTPPGGTWSGDQITADGFFIPQNAGTYSVTYEINGCSETLDIDVQDLTPTLPFTEICQSAATQYLDVQPQGGLWTGSGIDNGLQGTWEPEWTGAGGDITLTYNAIGCSMDYEVYVIPAQIGGVNQNTCPFSEPFLLDEFPDPAGGTFEGNGILDATTGLFDPGAVTPSEWHTLLYNAPTGCTDTVFMYVQDTEIFVDTAFFCIEDDPLPLDWDGIQRTPWGGSWTGSGAVNVENDYWEFFPDQAGVGEFELFYNNNTCTDSVLMIVYPSALNADTLTFCSAEEAQILEEVPPSGTWIGPGIIDADLGIFDPSLLPGESVDIVYETPTFCAGGLTVIVDEFVQAVFSEIDEVYCFQDIEVDTGFGPPDGVLTGPEETGIFNPSILDEGFYTYTYGYPDYYCSADSSISFTVLPSTQIDLTTLAQTLCDGLGTTLTATAFPGIPDGEIELEWSDGLFPQVQNIVAPESSQYYYVSAMDGCSDEVTDSIFIQVLEPIEISLAYGDSLCFGEDGAIMTASALPEANYNFFWDETLGTNTYSGEAGSIHDLLVVDVDFGCEYEDVVLLPSYSPISADFSLNPNLECIPFEANPVEFIDLSQNGSAGMWNFGNGDSLAYDGTNPLITYDLPGFYPISLVIFNEGNCVDSASTEICVNDPSVVFIPDVFSPNDDGNNDILFVRGGGILDLELKIYNRWGNMIFKSEDIEEGWDGYVLGNKAPTGVYVYQLFVRTENGLDIEQSGDITLVR